MKLSESPEFLTLCQRIALGLIDIDIADFQKRLDLDENWDWDDIGQMLDDGSLTMDGLTRTIPYVS